ncbi:hypothetical protein H632_c4706p0 [Helicosporidium sp. ATCC 50920]|nr:hypothetical protein H632_c4706p0 [Helicosporidium sp. ATCC 50920]|eukprot:KDD71604.1 hypothetical protein H632_c4706p0 [Helicosporidium sp. ATCC 50920]
MASVPAQELLPRLASGDAVDYHAPDGSCEEAVVAEVRDQTWPFVYVLRLASGGYVTSSAERLALREEEGGRRGAGAGDEPPSRAPEDGIGSRPEQSPREAPSAPLPQPRDPPFAPLAQPRDAPSAPLPQPSCPAFQPSLNAVVEAQKLTKTATSALSFEDVHTAVQLLEQALSLLTRA